MNISVLRNVFEKNENAAAENRARFDELGLVCLNLLGGAGSGKTSVLECVIPMLRPHLRIGVLEGDLATTKDAERIARLDVPVAQLLTDGGCHLTATLVQHALERLPLDELDLLIIENVGNPICPNNFDLGEHFRIGVLSVAEGDDKPAKYPLLFRAAAAILITKCDLLPYVEFDLSRTRLELGRLNPAAPVFETAAQDSGGMRRIAQWILSRCSRIRPGISALQGLAG